MEKIAINANISQLYFNAQNVLQCITTRIKLNLINVYNSCKDVGNSMNRTTHACTASLLIFSPMITDALYVNRDVSTALSVNAMNVKLGISLTSAGNALNVQKISSTVCLGKFNVNKDILDKIAIWIV